MKEENEIKKLTEYEMKDLNDLQQEYGEGRFNIEEGTFEPIDNEGNTISN